MTTKAANWQRIGGFTLAACLGFATFGYPQFTSFSDRSRAMLEGNWQSCREADGGYGERVYDGKWPGIGPFELHMGPFHEFALFRGIQDEHREHLYLPTTSQAVQRGNDGEPRAADRDVAGLRLEVAAGGGGREDCESWFVILNVRTRLRRLVRLQP